MGDIERGLAFYRDVVGFEVQTLMPSAAFVSAGGYHHHLGFNIWRGANVPPAPPGTVGLREWTVVLPEDGLADAARAARRRRRRARRRADRGPVGQRGALRQRCAEQVLQVEVAEDRRDVAVLVERPLLDRAVPGELEVVAVGVGEVDGLVRAVVGELAQRDAGLLQPPHRVGQARARRVVERDVVQAGDAVGLRAAARRLPRVEAEVVVVAAGGDEQDVARRAPAGDAARLGDDVEAEHAAVEGLHAVDVGRAQVDVADPHAGVDGARRRLDRLDAALLVECSWGP